MYNKELDRFDYVEGEKTLEPILDKHDGNIDYDLVLRIADDRNAIRMIDCKIAAARMNLAERAAHRYRSRVRKYGNRVLDVRHTDGVPVFRRIP